MNPDLGRGRRRTPLPVLAALAALLLLAGPSLATSWTQAGQDASRTGRIDASGPMLPDVALDLELPGELATADAFPGSVLIVDQGAYVPLHDLEGQPGPIADGVVRVDLAAGTVEPLLRLDPDQRLHGIATDGTHLLAAIDQGAQAYRLSDGAQVWRWTYAATLPIEPGGRFCAQPAVTSTTVYVGCTLFGNNGPQGEAFLAALNVATGEELGVWTPQRPSEPSGAGSQGPQGMPIFAGFSVVDRFLLVSGAQTFFQSYQRPCVVEAPCVGTEMEAANFTLFAFDPELAELRWRHSEQATRVDASAGDTSQRLTETLSGISVHPTGTSRVVYMRIQDHVMALNPVTEDGFGTEQGERVLWKETIGQQDLERAFTVGSFALGNTSLFTTSTETLYRFDRENPTDQWRRSLDPATDEIFSGGDLVLTDEILYATAQARTGNGSTVYAFQPETGDLLWRHRIPALEPGQAASHFPSAGDGLLVLTGTDGRLRVLGTTPASVQPVAVPSDPTPPTGEQVSVDLSGTVPGAQGPATVFRADWGDGTVTAWQTTPVLNHTYEEEGEVTATFHVRNEANQTARIQQTFHVGQTEPNFIETAFARDNQDLTFGVLGILVAITGGAIGVARRYRGRSRLQDELAAVEEAYQETKERPAECEAQLTERKTHARGLMLDGELTEEQFGVVERRIDELLRGLRMGAVEDEFDFLPYALVKKAREMLEDGKVSSLEAEAFLAAIDGDEVLTEDQKTSLRERIRVWRARDSSA